MSREIAKKFLTKRLGEVIEEEDKLICYVKKEKCLRIDNGYHIMCQGIGENELEDANRYGLNKKIVYIFEGIDFGREKVHITGYNGCDVIFRNCRFDYNLKISINGDCIIEDTTISNASILTTIHAHNLSIRNCSIIESEGIEPFFEKYKIEPRWVLRISAIDLIEIINTRINSPLAQISLISDNDMRISNLEVSAVKKSIEFNSNNPVNVEQSGNIYNIVTPREILLKQQLVTVLCRRKNNGNTPLRRVLSKQFTTN